jgi:hypothetical protein
MEEMKQELVELKGQMNQVLDILKTMQEKPKAEGSKSSKKTKAKDT